MAGEPEEAAAEAAEDHDGEAPGSRAIWRRNPFLSAAVTLLVAALAAAGVFGGLWASAASGGDAHYSQVRDHVLQVARGAAVNFTSIDYRHVEVYKKHAEQSTTGTLHKTLDKSIGKYTKKLSKSKVVVNGSVKQAALSSLDVHTGKATALVVVNVNAKREGKKPSEKRLPMTLNLKRVDSGWKVSSFGRNSGVSALPGQ